MTHVDACATCRQFRSDLLRNDLALDRIPASEPPSDFTARVVAALPDLEDSRDAAGVWFAAIRPARAAAAAIGLASGTLLALAMNGSSAPPHPQSVETEDAVFAQSFDAIPDDSAEARYLALLQESEN